VAGLGSSDAVVIVARDSGCDLGKNGGVFLDQVEPRFARLLVSVAVSTVTVEPA
jgi:hypothetical protein